MNKTVVRLGIISFFGDISSEMLYPITPIFLTTVLGASMTSLGMIEGFADGLASILKVYSGMWSDRIGKRKPFIVFGYLFAAMAKPFTGMATSWLHVLFARSFDRVGKGLRTAPRDALISESVLEKDRGKAFGLHRAMDTMGAALGPFIAIAFLSFYAGSLRTIYFWALIPGLLSVVLALVIQDKPIINHQPEERVKWKWGELPLPFKKYLVAWSLFSLTNSSDVFLLMRVKQSGASVTMTILLYVFYNLLYALLSPYFGKKSDQIPRKKVLFFGLIVFAFVYFGFSLANQLWHFWILFGLYGIYMAATEGVGKALAVDLFNPDLKATAIGILGTSTGIATIFASTFTGWIWDFWGSQWAFLYSAVGAVFGAILLRRI